MIAPEAARGLLPRLLLGEALLDEVPVLCTCACLALLELAATAQALALELYGWQLHLEANLVVKAEAVVYVCRRDLAGVDGADDRGRARLAVSAAEEPVEAGNRTVRVADNPPVLARHADGLEWMSCPIAT